MIGKAVKKWAVEFEIINPRDFCEDKHKQIDDYPYWWGAWMLLKAKPFVKAVEQIIKKIKKQDFKIVYLAPSKKFFNQTKAYEYSKTKNLIFVSWRYEGVDARFEQYLQKKYPNKFEKISIWPYITMWWEVPSMVIVESVVRLLPDVLDNPDSLLQESYSDNQNSIVEYPQYTRPQKVFDMEVPEVLLSGNHQKIQQRREQHTQQDNVDNQ